MTRNLFCARGPFCYGIGKTAEEAIKKAKKFWPSFLKQRPLAKNFDVFVTDAREFNVDEMGTVWVPGGFGLEQIQESALTPKRADDEHYYQGKEN